MAAKMRTTILDLDIAETKGSQSVSAQSSHTSSIITGLSGSSGPTVCQCPSAVSVREDTSLQTRRYTLYQYIGGKTLHI